MEKQLTFTDIDVAGRRKKPKKALFFERMEAVTPIKRWVEMIEPYYYKKGNGREPISLEIMLRMYLLSQWENYSDDKCEDVLCYDPLARAFVGVIGDPPDSTTLGKFRNLLEQHNLCQKIFSEEVVIFKQNNIIMQQGTGIDATIISAPDSRKNKEKKSNPEFSSTQKGNQRYRGFKAHIGVDTSSGLVHSVATTTAKESDVSNAHKCVHGSETVVRGDAGYIGIEKRPEICEKFADKSGEMIEVRRRIPNSDRKKGQQEKVKIHKMRAGIKFVTNKKRSTVKTRKDKKLEKLKSQRRWKAENPFLILKHIFGFRRTRLPNLAKNENKSFMMFTLVNCYLCSQKGINTKNLGYAA